MAAPEERRFILFSLVDFYYGPVVSDEEERQLQFIADAVTARGFREPAIFFLEMFKPLVGCAREVAAFGGPLLLLLFGAEWEERIKILLSSSDRVEALILKLEQPGDGARVTPLRVSRRTL